MSVETTNIGSRGRTSTSVSSPTFGGERAMSTQLSNRISIPSPRSAEGFSKSSMQTLYQRGESPNIRLLRGSFLTKDRLPQSPRLSAPAIVEINKSVPQKTAKENNFVYLYKRETPTTSVKAENKVSNPRLTETPVIKSTPTLSKVAEVHNAMPSLPSKPRPEIYSNPATKIESSHRPLEQRTTRIKTPDTAIKRDLQLQQIRLGLQERIQQRGVITLDTNVPTIQSPKEQLSTIVKPSLKETKTLWLTRQATFVAKKEQSVGKILISPATQLATKNEYLTKLQERTQKGVVESRTNITINEKTQQTLGKDVQIAKEEEQALAKKEEEYIVERDRRADRARIELAVKIGKKLLEESNKKGGDGVDASEIARLMPAKPLDLASRIRYQLRLSVDSEAQYDEFKIRLAKGGIIRSVTDISLLAIGATDTAPAVQISRDATTEPVTKTDEQRAVSNGNENLSI